MTPLATQTLALGPDWLDPSVIIEWLGPWALVGVAAIIFAECGLLLGFFLPGDSLLFTAGLFVATGQIDIPLWLMCVVLVVSAFAGNVVGYGIGYRAGPAIFDKPKSKLFNPKHVTKTHEFFEKYGNRAIVLGRFVPIVRTFITVTAGVARMDPRLYFTYSLIGGVAWAAGVTVLGYFLGQFTFVRENIDLILVLIVLISVLPIVIEVLRSRRKNRSAGPATAGAPADVTGGASDLTQPISMPRDGGAPTGPGRDGAPTSGSPDATETTWITPVGAHDPAPGGAPQHAPRNARQSADGGFGGAPANGAAPQNGGGPQGGPEAAPSHPDQPTRGLPSHSPAPVESRSSGRPVMGYPSPSRSEQDDERR